MKFEFKTLTDFTDYFRDEETCRKHYTKIRFGDGAYCPHCNHTEIYTFKDGKRYRCAKCKQDFTIKTGTVFGESKLPLRKWFIAIYLLMNSSKGISSVQLAKHVGVTQKTAWFMAHRIRETNQQNKEPLSGTVEADETYIGGLSKNMHIRVRKIKVTGTGGVNKTTIFGMKQRDGHVRAQVIKNTDAQTLHPIIKENLVKGSTLYSDELRGYNNLHENFSRGVVRHSLKEFVNGDCHTNGIESFWALFKRGYHGVYHHMSKKHLQRYVNEFSFRVNRRELSMQTMFSDVVAQVANSTQLPYKKLIEKSI